MVTMLNRVLWRDLWLLRGQVIAAALVVACGIATLVATRGTYQSLLMARDDYYLTHRFADVFVHLKRAPEALAAEIRQLPGVAQVRTRIVVEVTLDVPGLQEPAVARLVSIPGKRTAMLNDLQIVRESRQEAVTANDDESEVRLVGSLNKHSTLEDGDVEVDYSSNIYFLKGDEYLSIIDPGNDYTAYMQMVELGFKFNDIKKIAITHGHPDHVMGIIELFRGYRGFGTPDIEVYMHEAGPLEFKQMAQELGCRITELKGGETINLSGFELEVIHTPGHSPGGICLLAENFVIVGDVLFQGSIGRTDLPGGDYATLMASIRDKLLTLPDSTVVYPGRTFFI